MPALHAPNREAEVAGRKAPAAASVSEPAELDMDAFALILCGHSAFQLLWAGAELDLFTTLSDRGPLNREQIAAALGLAPQPTRILLHGLTALRLLKKDGPMYENGPLARRLLVRGASNSFLPILAWQHHIVYRGQIDFVESLKRNHNVGLRHFPGSGASLYERIAGDPFLEKVFQDAMSALSSQANRQLVRHLDLSSVRHLTDIGGGDGSNAIRLARQNPSLEVTVFDRASVTARARRKIEVAGVASRVHTANGDCFLDPLPGTCDAFLLCHMVTIWSEEKNVRLLRKCHRSLPDNGKLFIFNMVSWDDETGPMLNALGSPYFQAIASGEGMLYCDKDIRAWLRRAGFRKVRRQKLPMEHGLFVAEK